MDAVYILGSGSLANNKELEFSIRSLRQNMIDLQKIFVIGETPPEGLDVIHIPAEDPYPLKWQNILHKLSIACKIDTLSENFISMSDDYFVLETFEGASLPYYFRQGIDGGVNGIRNFDLHVPFKINKEAFLKMPLTVDMKGWYSPRTFYSNFFADDVAPLTDCIVVNGEGVKPFEEQVKGRDFFSVGNTIMLDPAFLTFLEKLYPRY